MHALTPSPEQEILPDCASCLCWMRQSAPGDCRRVRFIESAFYSLMGDLFQHKAIEDYNAALRYLSGSSSSCAAYAPPTPTTVREDVPELDIDALIGSPWPEGAL